MVDLAAIYEISFKIDYLSSSFLDLLAIVTEIRHIRVKVVAKIQIFFDFFDIMSASFLSYSVRDKIMPIAAPAANARSLIISSVFIKSTLFLFKICTRPLISCKTITSGL